MRSRRGVLAGGLLALLLGLSLTAPAGAQQRELPTGAGRVVAKIQLEILTGTNQLNAHIDQILANNASIIPGK